MEPSLSVSLYGTKGEAENLELKLWVRRLRSFYKHLDFHTTGYMSCFVSAAQDLTFLFSCLAEKRKLRQIRHIHSCWWPRRRLEICWCWSLNGRRTAGPPPACWRWFLLGGPVTRTARTWRFTKSESEPARANRSKLCVLFNDRITINVYI